MSSHTVVQEKEMRKPIKVFLVVDPDYAERLFDLPQEAPVWIVETDANAPVVRRIWLQNSKRETDAITTLFKTDLTLPPEKQILRVLEQVDLHHGPCAAGTPYSVLEVIGCKVDEEIEAELAEYGRSMGDRWGRS